MTGVELSGKEAGQDFFTVQDSVVFEKPFSISSTTFLLGQSIAPIIAKVDGEDKLRCLGTAFFISCSGLLVTAAHVITDPIDRNYGGVQRVPGQGYGWDGSKANFGVLLAVAHPQFGRGYLFRALEWAHFYSKVEDLPLFDRREVALALDVAICKVPLLANEPGYQPLTIIQPGLKGVGLQVGKTATAIGYGSMRDYDFTNDESEESTSSFKFDLHVSRGKILERFPSNAINKDVRTPGGMLLGRF